MHLTVKGKQLDVGDALRQHMDTSLAGIFGKYFGDALDASVLLTREAHLYRSQITVHVGRGIRLESRGEAEAPYAAFDVAAERLGKRLRRYKRRLRDHHRREVVAEPAQSYVLAEGEDESNESSDGPPVVVAEMATEVPTLTVSEAIMRLELAEETAMLFRNRAHSGFNMIYRRADGNIGWVDPTGNRGT